MPTQSRTWVFAVLLCLTPPSAFADGTSRPEIVPYQNAPVSAQSPKHHESRLNGVLIGAALGAAIGIFGVGMADCPGDNPSGPCTGFRVAGYAMVIGIGGLVGFGIDSLAGQQSMQPTTPVASSKAVPTQRRIGVRLAIRW